MKRNKNPASFRWTTMWITCALVVVLAVQAGAATSPEDKLLAQIYEKLSPMVYEDRGEYKVVPPAMQIYFSQCSDRRAARIEELQKIVSDAIGDAERASGTTGNRSRKRAAIRRKKEAETELRKLLRDKRTEALGLVRLPVTAPLGNIEVGSAGVPVYGVKVFQVVDEDEAILSFEKTLVWMKDFPTTGLVDDEYVAMNDPILVYGTTQYDTAMGSTNTIYVATTDDPEKYRKKLTRKKFNEIVQKQGDAQRFLDRVTAFSGSSEEWANQVIALLNNPETPTTMPEASEASSQ